MLIFLVVTTFLCEVLIHQTKIEVKGCSISYSWLHFCMFNISILMPILMLWLLGNILGDIIDMVVYYYEVCWTFRNETIIRCGQCQPIHQGSSPNRGDAQTRATPSLEPSSCKINEVTKRLKRDDLKIALKPEFQVTNNTLIVEVVCGLNA